MKDDAQISMGGIIILIAVIIVIGAMMWFLLLPPSCEESEQIELTGTLLGFEKNNTVWNVRFDNNTYQFGYFDKGYMERMLGFNITVTACYSSKYYDFLNAYVNEEID